MLDTSNNKCETVTSNANVMPKSKPTDTISDLTYSTSSSKKIAKMKLFLKDNIIQHKKPFVKGYKS